MDHSNRIRQYSVSYRYIENENREWRRAGSDHTRRKPTVSNKRNSNPRRKAILGIVVMIVIIALIIVPLLFLFHNKSDVKRECVPGFVGDRCERTDFIGTYRWSSSLFYKLDDGLQYNSGIAFRVYAPLSVSVTLTFRSKGSTDKLYEML